MEAESGVFDDQRVTPGDHAVVHWRNVAIFVWCARATGESVKAGVDFAGELGRKYPQFSVLHVVEESAGLPTPEGREQFVAVARRNKQAVACFGLLLPKSAVLASLLRSFVRGVRTLLRAPLDVIIHDDLATLASELAAGHLRKTGVRFTAYELADAVQRARLLARGERAAGRMTT